MNRTFQDREVAECLLRWLSIARWGEKMQGSRFGFHRRLGRWVRALALGRIRHRTAMLLGRRRKHLAENPPDSLLEAMRYWTGSVFEMQVATRIVAGQPVTLDEWEAVIRGKPEPVPDDMMSAFGTLTIMEGMGQLDVPDDTVEPEQHAAG